MVSRTSAIPWGSSPLIGSSRTRRSGSPTSASPIPRPLLHSKGKMFRFFSFRHLPVRPSSKISSMYPFSEYQTIHILFSGLYMHSCCHTAPVLQSRHPTRERILSSSFPLHPNISISPAVGLASPLIIFRSSLFPAPFRPINP